MVLTHAPLFETCVAHGPLAQARRENPIVFEEKAPLFSQHIYTFQLSVSRHRLLYSAMNTIHEKTENQPPEMTSLDARIAQAGGTSSRIELQPHRLRQTKIQHHATPRAQLEDLVRENSYLRQEIVFYQESRNAMLAFHSQVFEAYQGLNSALKELSEKLAKAEGRIEKYWGISLNGTGKADITIL